MGYLAREERDSRLGRLREAMESKALDLALVYYDEFNIGNGWYLTGWCPQFESGAVLVPRRGEPMILGGPESEPFAKLDSAITETRNFPVFMVPDEEYPNATITDFRALFAELKSIETQMKRVGLVGAGRMPADCHRQIVEGFKGVELVDFTREYVELRYLKSPWEREQIRSAFELADDCYAAMKAKNRSLDLRDRSGCGRASMPPASEAQQDLDSAPSSAAESGPMRWCPRRPQRNWSQGNWS